MASIVAMMTGP